MHVVTAQRSLGRGSVRAVPVAFRRHKNVRRVSVSASSDFEVRRFDDWASSSRDKVLDAVEGLRNRATAAEVAAASGLPIKVADRCMQSLVQDVKGTMQVSSAGDLVYEVPSNFRAQLLASSLKLRVEPGLKAAASALAYGARLAFGAALFASIATTYIAIAAIASSSSSDDRGRGRGDGGFRMSSGPSFNLFYDPYSVWFWDPYYARKARMRKPQDMNLLESVFSVVFGDGDPNADYEEQRWARAAAYIKSRGGVVTALELAPILDPPDAASLDDEAFMVPALLKFDGEVKILDDGSTLYVFPQLQRVSSPVKKAATSLIQTFRNNFGNQLATPQVVDASPMLEKPWQLSKAPPGNKFAAWALAAVNVGGVAYLSSLVSTVSARALALNNLAWIPAVLPALQAYAALFIAIPTLRFFWNARKNAAIEKRNAARVKAAQKLTSGSSAVKNRIAQARSLAQTVQISDDDVVYDTNEEANVNMEEYLSFDRKLQERQGLERDFRRR